MVDTHKAISLEESKVIQMDILSAVDKFCAENGITYSMACGTMLGAVRHKGFIPWDDDIDIYMLRDEYDRFIASFPLDYEGKFRVICRQNDDNWESPFAKIYDSRTVSVDEIADVRSIGINMDLFPIDDVPDDEAEWLSYRQAQIALRKKISAKIAKLSSCRSFFNKIKMLAKKSLLLGTSSRRLNDRRDAWARINDGKGYSRVFECSCGMYCKNPFPKSLFDDIVYWPFEDRMYKGFKDADTYLTATYGSYMELPPVEKRVSHHSTHDYWK